MKQGWSRFMDRRLKERLAGATILIVLIVLIVPELLSGPKRAMPARLAPLGAAEPVRNITVDLATSKALPAGTSGAGLAGVGAAQSSTAGAAADDAISGLSPPGLTPAPPATPSSAADVPVRRSVAPPSISTLQAQQPSATVENGVSSPTSQSAPRAAAMPMTPAAAPHTWAVQLGSFASRVNAETLEHRLRAKGFSAFVASSGAGKTLRYRVRVGPVADRGGAEKIVAKLRKDGHAASVVAP